ncbi:hypothetical protein JKF63_06257 [Porcisia hertigi]|uniref:U-box domain-containing protein n=1 Tax=Porcisia hertigi TaxID=2761500 RepID=A0A836INH6_9TRYP|nr:hypothetical protein JKF63_06257 [Porcisia hertigi]
MSLHPAVQLLCDQSIDAIGLTTVSSVAAALGDVSVATDLIQRPEQVKALQDVLNKCMSILKNDAKNFTLRLACLECLYTLSQPPIPVFRTGLLHKTLDSMNSSVEELLVRTSPNDAESISSAREMLTVLIFRTTNYDTRVGRLLLEHTCNGNAGSMLETLLRITVHHRETCEWPLLQAALLSLYELTLPATYYATGEDSVAESKRDSAGAATDSSLQTFTLESFQARIAALLTEMREHRVLEQLLTSLRLSWCDSTCKRSPPSLAQGLADSVMLGALGRPDVAHTVTSVSTGQQMELQNWLAAFSLLCRAMDNMVEFCCEVNLVTEMRVRLLGDPGCHDWLASAAVPAVIAAIQSFVSDVDASASLSESGTGSDVVASTTDAMRCGLLATAVTLLRLLRMALYRPVVGFTKEFLSSMARLAEQVQRAERYLRHEYGGVLVMMLTVQCLVNMNGIVLTSPVNLEEAFRGLLKAILLDNTECTLSNFRIDAGRRSVAPGVRNPFEKMLVVELIVYLASQEDSPFCETNSSNESVVAYGQAVCIGERLLEEKHKLVFEENMLRMQFSLLQRLFMLQVLQSCLTVGMDVDFLSEDDVCQGRNLSAEKERPELLSEKGLHPQRGSTRSRAEPTRHPTAYVCGLTKKLMREPVVLKNGRRFEYDALQNVIGQLGHVDPISGEAIDEEIEVDIALQQEISAYRVKCALHKRGS